MTLCFFLKLLGEFSFYFFAANVALSIFGLGIGSLVPLLLPAAIGAMCFALYQRRPSFVMAPLPFALLCLLFAGNIWEAIVIALPCLYLFFTCRKKAFFLNHSLQQDTFTGLLKASAFIFPIVLTMSAFYQRPPLMMPLFLIFFFSNILLLRMLRHTPESLSQRRLKIVSAIEICLFIGLVLFLSSPTALNAAVAGVSGVFQLLVAPVLMLFVYAAAAVVWLLGKLFSGLKLNSDTPIDVSFFQMAEQELANQETQTVSHPVLLQVFQGIFILALLAVAFFFFRRMLAKRQVSAALGGAAESRSSVAKPSSFTRPPADRFPPREPRAAVRYYYRRFLALCIDLGFPLTHSYDSSQVSAMMGSTLPKERLSQLRQVYIKARYSQHTVTKEDAAQAKAVYQQIKADAKEKTAGTGK